MNQNVSLHGWSTFPECEIYHFLGGKLDQTETEAYVALVFIIVMSILTCPITTALNLLVMIAVKIKRRLRTTSNVALACLSLTDGLIGLIGQPIFIAVTMATLQGEASSETCNLQQLSRIVVRLLVAASMFHLVLMSGERYIAIYHSLEHITMVTEARILGFSTISWVCVLLNIPLIAAGDEVYLPVNNTIMFLSIAIIIFFQLKVYCQTRRHEKEIAAQQVSVEARQKFLKEKKAFHVTTTVLLCLVLTYSPIFVVRILLVKSVISSIGAEYVAYFASVFVLILNSFINPIIYCVRMRQFRVAFIEIVFRKSNAQAEDIDRRVFGKFNAVPPLQGEERNETQNNGHDNLNNNNINNSIINNGNINNRTTTITAASSSSSTTIATSSTTTATSTTTTATSSTTTTTTSSTIIATTTATATSSTTMTTSTTTTATSSTTTAISTTTTAASSTTMTTSTTTKPSTTTV